MSDHFRIALLHTPAELKQAVDLQKVYWGEDMGDNVPLHMLLSIAHYGGHIYGAFDGERLIGMLIGFMGADIQAEDAQAANERLLVMSKRMVVLPEFRGRRVGELLKLAQRDFALRHNIPLVTWTFDPMLARNAYLNLHKLRGVIQKYVVDFFGPDAQNPTLQADRVSVSWWVSHARMTMEVLPDHSTAPVVNPAEMQGERLIPAGGWRFPDEEGPVRVEIPSEFVALAEADPALGQTWRLQVRSIFHSLLARGLLATDFVRVEGRAYYVFTPDDGTYRFAR